MSKYKWPLLSCITFVFLCSHMVNLYYMKIFNKVSLALIITETIAGISVIIVSYKIAFKNE
jgi:hypothetical protein